MSMQDTAVGLFELLHCERCTRYISDVDSEVMINTKIREFELISYLSLVSEANVSGAVTLQGIYGGTLRGIVCLRSKWQNSWRPSPQILM